MRTDPTDSGGGSQTAGPVQGPSLEETEGVSLGPASLHAPPRQDVELEGEQPCRGALVPAGPKEQEEAEWGQAGLAVPMVSCPMCRGASIAVECAEGDQTHNWTAEGGEAPLGAAVSAAPSAPEQEALLPSAKEQNSGSPLGFYAGEGSAESGQEFPLGEGVGTGAPAGTWEEDRAPLRDQQEEAAAGQSCCIQAEEPSEESECPICTELYDWEGRRPAPLNCGHILCGRCLTAIMEAGSAADIGRVRCPICRQKTPMMEWEICRLQEELLLLGATQGPAPPTPLFFTPLPARRPGFWGGLEHHFQVRFHTTRTIGFLPCLRYPPRLIQGLAHLEGHCRWGYRLALLSLLATEGLSLMLVFLPVALLLLVFLIMDQ